MARGPNGEYRPDDPVAAAIMVAKIATGEIEEVTRPPRQQVTFTVVADQQPDANATVDQAINRDLILQGGKEG